MKKIAFFLFVFLISSLFPLSVQGENLTPEDIASEAGVYDLSGEYLTEEEIKGEVSFNIFGKALAIIKDSIGDKSRGVLASFGSIMAVLVICCVMHSMNFGKSEGLDVACAYISVLALSGVVYGILYKLFIFVIASMESLTLAMSSLLPVMGSLYVMGGSPATGAASSGALSLILTVISLICTKVAMPLLRIIFALSLTGALPSGTSLSAVIGFLKGVCTWLLSFLFTLLGTLLFFQTSISAASDGYFSRSVRFLSGAFVPIIGGLLGDATRMVISAVSVVKASVGAVGLILILSAILPALIGVILNKLMLLFCSTLAKTLGCEKEGAMLCDLGGILNVLLALVAGAGCVCIIALAVFIKSGGLA